MKHWRRGRVKGGTGRGIWQEGREGKGKVKIYNKLMERELWGGRGEEVSAMKGWVAIIVDGQLEDRINKEKEEKEKEEEEVRQWRWYCEMVFYPHTFY